MSGGQKICMTDSVGRMLFSVPDGGIIRMLYGNGEDYFAVCHYLDEIIYVFLTIFLYLLKCPQSLILSALRAFFLLW